MKIGLLTYHCPPNFGAQLQAISMVGYLQKLGHEVIVLNWYPADLDAFYKRRVPLKQIQCHEEFTIKNLPITKLIRTENELVDEINRINLDAVLVGSDALFKYAPIKKRYSFCFKKKQVLSCLEMDGNPFFGSFISKIKKRIPMCAFSVSSQNCPFELMNEEESAKMRNCFENFNYITVRDEWTKKMVEQISSWTNIKITPDPVFSFNQNSYLNIPTKDELREKYGLPENYVLVSFTNKFIQPSYVRSIADELVSQKISPVALPMPEGLQPMGITEQVKLPLSPLDWYGLIIHSHGYIGERMHPIVVCLHNSIPFYSFDYYGIHYRDFLLRKRCISSSSKTYLIVKDAGFVENIYTYFSKQPMPTAKDIVEKIVNFDTVSCQNFSIEKQNQFNQAIEQVLSHLLT